MTGRSSNIPRKHHYVPVFYLKQWTGKDRQLCEYKRLRGRILTRRMFPDGTGYEKDLYRVDGLPEVLATAVESVFMHMVDTEAKHALDKIISDEKSPWDAKMRSAWVRFILSLRFRNPETVRVMKEHMKDIWQTATDELRANYERGRLPTEPTFEEFLTRSEPEPFKAALLLLQQSIDNDRVGPTIFAMHWSSVSLTASRLPLLTSDRPLYMPPGLLSMDARIVLPISPTMVFVAGHDDRWEKGLRRSNPTQVVRTINGLTVSQARMFVWGIYDSQLRFVENHIGEVPDRPIITDAQKQAAISATREHAKNHLR